MLAPSEIAALGAALSEIENPFTAAAIRFLMLTGWRGAEARALRWENVNMETGEVLLPTTKTGRDMRTLGAAALEIIANLPRVNGNPHVFAGGRSASVSYKDTSWCLRRCMSAGRA